MASAAQPSAKDIVRACLEDIHAKAVRHRQLVPLKQKCQEVLARLDDLFDGPPPGAPSTAPAEQEQASHDPGETAQVVQGERAAGATTLLEEGSTQARVDQGPVSRSEATEDERQATATEAEADGEAAVPGPAAEGVEGGEEEEEGAWAEEGIAEEGQAAAAEQEAASSSVAESPAVEVIPQQQVLEEGEGYEQADGGTMEEDRQWGSHGEATEAACPSQPLQAVAAQGMVAALGDASDASPEEAAPLPQPVAATALAAEDEETPRQGGVAGGEAAAEGSLPEAVGRELMAVLNMAVATKRKELCLPSLMCVQRLIAAGHLRGTVLSSKAFKSGADDGAGSAAEAGGMGCEDVPYIDQAVGQAAGTEQLPVPAQAVDLLCRMDSFQDAEVEVAVLQGLLTALTSTTFVVHGTGLVAACRMIWNLVAMSRSETSQTTARAALVQIVSVVFQRLEARSMFVDVRPLSLKNVLDSGQALKEGDLSFAQSVLNNVVGAVLQPLDAGGQRTPFDSPAGNGSDSDDAAEVAPGAAEAAADDADAAIDAPAAHEQQLPPSAAAADGPAGKSEMEARLQLDAYRLLKALVRIFTPPKQSASMYDFGFDQQSIRQRMLGGELLRLVFENCGPEFRRMNRMVELIREHLLPSFAFYAAKSGQSPALAGLACSIFVCIVVNFRHELKTWVGHLFPLVLLRGFEDTSLLAPAPGVAQEAAPRPLNRDVKYMLMELQALERVCADGQLLVDLFANYDCDVGQKNDLFHLLTGGLIRQMQLAPGEGAPKESQEQALKQRVLKCLSLIMASLDAWYVAASSPAAQAEEAGASSCSGQPSSDQVPEHTASSQSLVGMDTGQDLSRTAPAREDLDERRNLKKKLMTAVQLFNEKPKKGIAYLVEEGLVKETPEEVAAWLSTQEGLEKTQIGEYFGDPGEFNVKCMQAYSNGVPMVGLEIDDALRAFLMGFRLPGEAQKIDRSMLAFASRYVTCNPTAFEDAEVAYVLSYSIIMLNTDAHNPTVKNKMTKHEFKRNNRGINNGKDLDGDYLEGVYDRIVNNEIKLKGEMLEDMGGQLGVKEVTVLSNVLSAILGRRPQKESLPNTDQLSELREYLSSKALNTQFFSAQDPDTVRVLVAALWAPLNATLSRTFEEADSGNYYDQQMVSIALDGFRATICITARLGLGTERDSFLNALFMFTGLHAPRTMLSKNSLAFKTLLQVAEQVGNCLAGQWMNILRHVSKFEELLALHLGGPSDDALFAPTDPASKVGPGGFMNRLRSRLKPPKARSPVPQPVVGVQHMAGRPLAVPDTASEDGGSASASGGRGGAHDSVSSVWPTVDGQMAAGASGSGCDGLPQQAHVLDLVDTQEINRLFVGSGDLANDAVVDFVRALIHISEQELSRLDAPRVFCLTKIVEISHFNMERVRLVWSRLWSLLSEFFVRVGTHPNLNVAMYAVDSLRQLAMKFLERDELANFSFQNEFLRPFVIVMRLSGALEIRELIIRCVSQMVLARVANVKSGWKSMFMVFTTAASDRSAVIVALAFETIERIVRQHFSHITETEASTFTDCVNCLIAFTNNPHSINVALNAIAFLRFCAERLAEGDIGDVEEIPEGAADVAVSLTRIKSTGPRDINHALAADDTSTAGAAAAGASGVDADGRFTDRKEHVFYWFPLLFGLSELTFDPRPQIRHGALELLFDTLNYHGHLFSASFWRRILDRVLLPIFDYVRAEVTDTFTFHPSESERYEKDRWLYETCTQCLQHLVDLYVKFFHIIHPMLDKLLLLLRQFMERAHQSLAAVGVAAFSRLVESAGASFLREHWQLVADSLMQTSQATLPGLEDIITPPSRLRSSLSRESPSPQNGSKEPVGADAAKAAAEASTPSASSQYSLQYGVGARRLAELRCRRELQVLLVQAGSALFDAHQATLSADDTDTLLQMQHLIAANARANNSNLPMRQRVALQQAADAVPEDRVVEDPPLLSLEIAASHAYLTMLLFLHTSGSAAMQEACEVERRLVDACVDVLDSFMLREQQLGKGSPGFRAPAPHDANGSMAAPEVGAAAGEVEVAAMCSAARESAARAPLVVASLQALMALPGAMFQGHLARLFPLLTQLIRCEQSSLDVQVKLSQLFEQRVGPLLSSL